MVMAFMADGGRDVRRRYDKGDSQQESETSIHLRKSSSKGAERSYGVSRRVARNLASLCLGSGRFWQCFRMDALAGGGGHMAKCALASRRRQGNKWQVERIGAGARNAADAAGSGAIRRIWRLLPGLRLRGHGVLKTTAGQARDLMRRQGSGCGNVGGRRSDVNAMAWMGAGASGQQQGRDDPEDRRETRHCPCTRNCH